MASRPSPTALTIRPVDADTRADFVRLFEGRGAPSYCWCMVWRATPAETRHTDRASRRLQMLARVDAGTPVGLLAYQDGEPVAWCSIAPRETFRPSLGGVTRPGDEPGAVWSLTCFYVHRTVRRRGVMRALIAAAVDHARARGARVLEAYPVDADSPSYRFTGRVDVFRRLGFRAVGTAGTRRHVMRKALRAGRARARPAARR